MTGTLMYYLTHTVSGHIDTMNRFNFNLLMAVRDMFNWTFVLSRTSTWGYVKNGRYDGMIGALIRNETDIGGAPIFYWLERHKWIAAAGRSWSSRPCFIFRHPRNTQKDRIVFLQPFSNDVWVLILICGVFTVLILWLLTTIEWKLVPQTGAALIKPKGGAPRRHKHHHVQPEQEQVARSVSALPEPDDESVASLPLLPIEGTFWQRVYARLNNYISRRQASNNSPERTGLFLESVLFFVGIICQQGLGFSTSFVSGRTIVITSLLFSFCIYQFYSASIVGTLLMEKPKTIKTLSDLVHSTLDVGVEDIVYNRDYFLVRYICMHSKETHLVYRFACSTPRILFPWSFMPRKSPACPTKRMSPRVQEVQQVVLLALAATMRSKNNSQRGQQVLPMWLKPIAI